MWFFRFASLLIVVAVVCGCTGKPGAKSVKVTPPSPAENAKATLKEFAETGQIGSGLMLVRESFEAIQKTDAAKGGALLKELDELSKAKNPDEVKAKAKALMDKL